MLSYVGDGGNGTDAILIWADADSDGVRDITEPQTAAIREWITSPVTGLTLSPSSATNPAGTTHRMTATISSPQSGIIIRFRVVSGPNQGDPRIGTTDTNGQSELRYDGTGGIGVDTILAWADLNRNGILDADEPRDTATKTWVTSSSGGLSISPSTDSNPVDTVHSVTTTLSPAQANVLMRFSISSGPNIGESGVTLTDASGRATYSYVGDGGAGVDVILAWADLDGDTVHDSIEPSVVAIKTWVTDATAAIVLSPSSDTNTTGTTHTVQGTISPVATGTVVRFRIFAGPQTGVNIRALTNSAGQVTFSYVGSLTGSDLITGWIDEDDDGVLDSGESRAFASAIWVAVAGSGFSLSPTSDTNPLGTVHSMTATVSPAERDLLVRFEVTSGPNAGTKGSDDTNSSGIANLSYLGDGGLGTDVILCWLDFDRDGRVDAGEPQAIATKQWTTLAVAGLSLTPDFDRERVGRDHRVTAQLNPAAEGVRIRFEVIAGPNTGETGRDRTDGNGRVSFKYEGEGGVGTDLILAWADVDDDGVLDAGEHQASALVEWQAGFVDNALVEEICDDLDRHSHPSLKTLCRLVESGKLSAHAEEVIMVVIIKQAGFDHDHRGHESDDDDDD